MELKHAILGLLSIRPMSGYDLGRAFTGSVAHFWHADQSQIYRTIDRLAAAGAIDTEVISQDGKPDRKVHALTDAGQTELNSWLSGPVETARPKLPMLAQLFFVARLGRADTERLLDEYEAQVRGELDRLRMIDVGDEKDAAAALRASTLRYGITMGESELVWLGETRARLQGVEEWP